MYYHPIEIKSKLRCPFLSDLQYEICFRSIIGELCWSYWRPCISEWESSNSPWGNQRGVSSLTTNDILVIVVHFESCWHLKPGNNISLILYFVWQVTEKPVAVGFGISKPEHVKQVNEFHHTWKQYIRHAFTFDKTLWCLSIGG